MIYDTKTRTMIHLVININRVYKRMGFHISTLRVDEKFGTDLIWSKVVELHVTLNPLSEDENIPTLERYFINI